MKRILSLIPLLLLLLDNGRVPTEPIGDITEPTGGPASPTAVANNQPTPQPAPAPQPDSLPPIGLPWTGITAKDSGFCEGYGMPAGNGVRPSLSWPVPGGTLHEGRGFRVGHTGIDIDAAEGTAVQAAAAGTVVWAGWSTWGFGNMVAVSHGGGWWTLYGHLSAVTVTCGQWVGGGAVIGSVGQTGASNFPHLHFELRNGAYSFDSLLYLPN